MHEILLAILATMTPVPDAAGRPILWPDRYPATVVAAVERYAPSGTDPVLLVLSLAVIGAHESGYATRAVGDHGASCGIYQTPCAQTPEDAVGQARVAIQILTRSWLACPEHPLAIYASGHCAHIRVATWYQTQIAERFAIGHALTL